MILITEGTDYMTSTTLHEKCGKIMRENTDQKNSEYGHILRSAGGTNGSRLPAKSGSDYNLASLVDFKMSENSQLKIT